MTNQSGWPPAGQQGGWPPAGQQGGHVGPGGGWPAHPPGRGRPDGWAPAPTPGQQWPQGGGGSYGGGSYGSGPYGGGSYGGGPYGGGSYGGGSYGGGPYGGGPSGPAGPGGQRPGGWGPLVLVLVGALALVLVGVATWAALGRQASTPTAGPSPGVSGRGPAATPTKSASASSTPRGDASGRPESCPTTERQPVVPGWRAIASQRDGAAVDIPPDWSFNPGVVFGQESDSELILAHCQATYLKGVCPAKPMSDRAQVGFFTYGSKLNPDGDALKLARNWARLSQYDNKQKVQHPFPEPTVSTIKVNGGKTEAQLATVTWDVSAPDATCPAPRGRVSVISFPTEQKRASVVVAVDLGIDKELSADIEKQIISSLRPL